MRKCCCRATFIFFLVTLIIWSSSDGFSANARKIPVKLLDSLLIDAENTGPGPDIMQIKTEYALNLSRRAHYKKGIIHGTFNLARAYYYKTNYRQAFYILDTLQKSIESDSVAVAHFLDYSLLKSRIYTLTAIIFEESGDLEVAMDYYFKALKRIRNKGCNYDEALIYKGLGELNLRVGNLARADDYFNRAITLSKNVPDKKIQFDIYLEQYDHYLNKKQYDKALASSLKLLEISKLSRDPYMIIIASKNAGEVYYFLEEFNLAEAFLKGILRNQANCQFPNVLSETYSLLARLSLKNHQSELALLYAGKALQFADSTGLMSLKSKAYLDLSDIYKAKGNYAQAFQYLKDYTICNDSIVKNSNAQKVLELQSAFDLDQVMNEKKLVESQLTNSQLHNSFQKYVILGAIVIIILLVTLSIALYRKSKFEKRATVQLASQQNIISEQDNLLLKEQENKLQLEIEHRNRELVSRTILLTQQKESNDRLIKSLKKISEDLERTNNTNSLALDKIISELKVSTNNTTWEDFTVYFENVYNDFYTKLEKSFPELTPNEKKLCAFLKLNLRTKDIAAITSREVRSIESSRVRLRKKLNLPADASLTAFLSKI